MYITSNHKNKSDKRKKGQKGNKRKIEGESQKHEMSTMDKYRT